MSGFLSRCFRDGLNYYCNYFGMRISEQFQITLWNLKREQHISLPASAWYPLCPIPKRPFPLAGPVVSAPTVSSHVEFTAA